MGLPAAWLHLLLPQVSAGHHPRLHRLATLAGLPAAWYDLLMVLSCLPWCGPFGGVCLHKSAMRGWQLRLAWLLLPVLTSQGNLHV